MVLWLQRGLLVFFLLCCIAGAEAGLIASPASAGSKDRTLEEWQYLDEGFNASIVLQRMFLGDTRGYKCRRLSRTKAKCVAWTDYWVFPPKEMCRVCHSKNEGTGEDPYRKRAFQFVTVYYIEWHFRAVKSLIFYRRL